jgi:hypothetical protein
VKAAIHLPTRYEYAVKLMKLPAEGAPPPETGASRREIFNEVKILAALDHNTCLRMKARGARRVGRA